MGRKFSLIFLLLFLLAGFSKAQNLYWVLFTDKPETAFSAEEYYSTKAQKRRQSLGLSSFDQADLPVSEEYIQGVKSITGKVRVVSRWLNAVSVSAGSREKEAIASLPYVQSIEPFRFTQKTSRIRSGLFSQNIEGLLEKQLAMMRADCFERLELNGEGVRIAIFDAGFPGVDTHPAFAHIREEGRIIATWDFVRDHENVYAHNEHGTMVMSCIAGEMNGKKIGLATGAEFLLARTERAGEPFSEEENWFEAMEWADRNGADIISSSLGYTYHRYFRDQMDGHRSLVSRAANIAASKGILVVNAMGNDGSSKWEICGTPADADSVLSVGGIDPYTGIHIGFSSFGPAVDGTTKPNVSAVGHAAVAGKKGLKAAFGTSFSTPLITGFAACVKQMHPEWGGMNLFHRIEESGHLYPYYDYAHGYGVPQASFFTDDPLLQEPPFSVSPEEESWEVHILKSPEKEENGPPSYLYYHIVKTDGILKKYAVIRVDADISFHIPKQEVSSGEILRISYMGKTISIHPEEPVL